jgi:mannosyltransferase OCH1-like enzyme
VSRFSAVIRSMVEAFPFSQVKDQIPTLKMETPIPNQVFQTWEFNSFGRVHCKSINEFRKINSSSAFFLFDREQRDSYMRNNWGQSPIAEAYFRAQYGVLKADIFRYCVVYQYGGYYMDISKGLSCKFQDLHRPTDCALITFEQNKNSLTNKNDLVSFPDNLVAQWAFGFSKQHPLLAAQIQSIEDNYVDFFDKPVQNPKLAILELSGPHSFTRNFHKFMTSVESSFTSQAGIDFIGRGIYSLSGSASRYLQVRGYAKDRNMPLFR